MSDPSRRERMRDLATRIGIGVAAFTVFTSGWIAMQSHDWTTIGAVTALAAIAGLVAASLSARRRR